SHPLVYGDLVYAVAGGDGQVLVAFDKKTGEERWRALSSEEAGYCPPKIVNHAGVEHLLFWYPEAVVSLNPTSGKPYWSYELKPIYGIARMAPQLLGNKLFVSGPGKNVAALLELDEDKPGVRELWRGARDKAVYPLNAPPQMRKGVIYGLDGEGSALIAVSMKDGERLWSSTAPSLAADAPEKSRHGSAFLVYHEANQQYWIFGEMGDLILAELSAEGYKELGRQHLLEPTNQAWGRNVVWTHPAFADRSVFVRNDKEIVRVDLSEPRQASAVKLIDLKLTATTTIEGTDRWDWWQARTAAIPGDEGKPRLITTMSETGKDTSHDFHDIYQSVSDDRGETWSAPELIESLKRHRLPDGYEVAPGDLWPTYHVHSNKVLTTGKTFNFRDGTLENRLLEKVSYAVMDPADGEWGPMRFLELPEKDHAGQPIIAANAGNTQRVDLPNGEILLPVRYERDPKQHNYTSIVCRCAFDGETLTYKEHGSELGVPEGRGLYEPSLTTYRGRYFLTLRADHSGFVTSSTDGIHFDPVREWTFDDGEPLGSYNTQQHWVTVGGGLFLVYTRRGADNDHVFRHRAPLFIAQVDPDSLQVIRTTERILLPENGATLGNSGICRVSDNESWVTCGEGLMRLGKRKGERNQVLFVKITPE
ncbi:MAG: PQQ-binding-like beta-propeller repeat protein, partial [Verrucomicrobiales bacterium]|nr:PQQ-binding-like beta-propeller repeat protein [Verrucomicrobiales bacterium]